MNWWNSRGYWGVTVRISESPWYTIQVGKSTDIDNNACFCAYIFQEDMHEDMWYIFLCQPTPQLQNVSSLWIITYQEHWIGHFVLIYARMEWLLWLDGFLVSLLESKTLFLNVSLCIVSSIEKCWLTKKCPLNITVFCRMWIKWSHWSTCA